MFAYNERLDKKAAEKAKVTALYKLDGAEQANQELAQKVPKAPAEEIREKIIRDFRLRPSSPDETLRQLEQKAKAEPDNSQLQKNLYMFRALKNSH